MAVNISNTGDLWTLKLFRESWFFVDVDESLPVLNFLVANQVKFSVSSFDGGLSFEMVDSNFSQLHFWDLQGDCVLSKCLDFKKCFGDRCRVRSNEQFPLNLVKKDVFERMNL